MVAEFTVLKRQKIYGWVDGPCTVQDDQVCLTIRRAKPDSIVDLSEIEALAGQRVHVTIEVVKRG